MKYTDFNQFRLVIENIMEEMSIDKETIKLCLDCKKILYIKLSEVNVMPDNRPGSRSKQTHIHISGKNMNMFYTTNELEQARKNKKSTDDEKVNIYLINKNLHYLEQHGQNDSIIEHDSIKGAFNKTYTYKKISIRADGSEQVQISKFRLDDKLFLDFRKLLYVHYGLLFFERKDGQGLNVIGITKDFCEKYSINAPTLLLENIHAYEEIAEKQSEYYALNYSEELEDSDINLNDINITLFKGTDKTLMNRTDTIKITNKRSGKGSKKDYLKEQKNNQETGEFGEKLILNAEKNRLIDIGRKDLADKIEWTSKEKGDGLGYDIKSFHISDNGQVVDKYIEVKTTLGDDKPFPISINEVEKSCELSRFGKYLIVRIFNIDLEKRTYSYYYSEGSVDKNYKLMPVMFSASRI